MFTLSSPLLTLLLLPLSTLNLVRAADTSVSGPLAKCYYPPNPDPFYQPNDTPCNPEARNSNCCAPDDICLSNGLCWRANINRLHRGSCTDPTWQSPECTRICTSPGTHKNGFADVLECPTFNGHFYCNLGNASTCGTEHTLLLGPGYFADYRRRTPTLAPGSGGKATTVTVEVCSASASGLPTPVGTVVNVPPTVVPEPTSPAPASNGSVGGNTSAVVSSPTPTTSVLSFNGSSFGTSMKFAPGEWVGSSPAIALLFIPIALIL